jgi:hypothetical protein
MSSKGEENLMVPQLVTHEAAELALEKGSREKSHRERNHHPKRSRHRSDTDKRSHRSHSHGQNTDRELVVREPKKQHEDNPIFVVDKRGDPLIAKYGPDRAAVLPYRRGGSGRILGADGFLIIHNDGAREEFSIRPRREGSSALDHRNLFKAMMRKRPHPVRIRMDSDCQATEAAGTEDFLPIGSSKKRKRPNDDSASSGEEGPSYKSIHGKAKAHEFSDSDLDFGSDSSASQDNVALEKEDPLRQKSITLSRRVKDRPDDTAAWLELIAHQDDLMQAGATLDRDVTNAEVSSYAEIKISMFESALQHAKSINLREKLLLGLMKEGAKVWGSKAIAKKWDDIAKEEGNSFPLWLARLDSETTSIATFTFNATKAVYVERIHTISDEIKSQKSKSGETLESLSNQLIYVFLRVTRYLLETGYKELAIAAWQACLEVNFNRPAELHEMPSELVLDSFQDFWENEVPRIGEQDSSGWAAYYRSEGSSEAPEPKKDDKEKATESRDAYKTWGMVESLRAEKSRMPARLLDDGAEDDPFRVVMFSDIRELLFLIPSQVSVAVKEGLIDAFLIFSQFPPAFGRNAWIERALNDPFIAQRHDEFQDALRRGDRGQSMVNSEDRSKKTANFALDGIRGAMTLDLLFGGSKYFGHLANRSHVASNPDGAGYPEFVLNAIRCFVRRAGVDKLAEYLLAMEWRNNPKGIKKVAKSLLGQFPKLSLYLAYAQAEYVNGNIEAAHRVMAAALGIPMVRSAVRSKPLASANNLQSNPVPADDALPLWRSWAWNCLEQGQKESAVRRLCGQMDESEISPVQLLQTQQCFLNSRDMLFYKGEYESASAVAECLVLLKYLTAEGNTEPTSESQGNISSAMTNIWAFSERFRDRKLGSTSAHEILLQFAAKLLYFNATHG